MTTDSYRSTLPVVDAKYWEGTDSGELRIQQCDSCSMWRFPPSGTCPRCLSADYSWQVSAGRGVLWSWIRMHQRYFAAFTDRIPYNVAIIKLDEGPRMISSIVTDNPQDLRCGSRVEVVFARKDGEFTLPEFRIVGPGTLP
jgi:uncharacterized OB-fold protein